MPCTPPYNYNDIYNTDGNITPQGRATPFAPAQRPPVEPDNNDDIDAEQPPAQLIPVLSAPDSIESAIVQLRQIDVKTITQHSHGYDNV